jgi:hypothetical protein
MEYSFMNLKEDQKRYKVFMDESFMVETDTETRKEKWRYYELRGPAGSVYPYSETEMAVCILSNRIGYATHRQTKWPIIQDGDMEIVLKLPASEWAKAADIVCARKRPQLSEATKERLRSFVKRYAFRKGVIHATK